MDITENKELDLNKLKRDFELDVKNCKEKLAEQFLLDLKNIQDNFNQKIQSINQSQQAIKKQKNQLTIQQNTLAEIYSKKMQEFENLLIQAEVNLKKQQISMLELFNEKLKQDEKDLQYQQSARILKNLIACQIQVIEKIKGYFDILSKRISHQNFSIQSEQILNYLKSQIKAFEDGKQQIRKIIDQVRGQRNDMYEKALKIFKSKKQEVEQLQKIKNDVLENLQHQKATIKKLKEKQSQLYKQKTEISLKLHKNLSVHTEGQHQQQKKILNQASQRSFRQKNLGSLIRPSPQRQKDSSTIFFPSEISSSLESQAPICEISSNMDAQVQKNKYILVGLFLLSIIIWFF